MSGWLARLETLPRLSLMAGPTPLLPADRLSAALGGPRIWLKRDDLIPAAFGGNKVRALDLIAADALRTSADALVTGAGPLSNHVRASAAVAARAGMRCVAVYWGSAPSMAEGNHRLTRMLGADIRFTCDWDRPSVDRGLAAAAAEIAAKGGRPYAIPRGGACPLAVLAHVLAVRETLDQCAAMGVAPTCVVMAAGGGATLAGWLLGGALFGAPWRIEAVTVSRPAEEVRAKAGALASEAAALIGCAAELDRAAFAIHDGFIGDGYGRTSPEGQAAIVMAARTEAVFLDPVYTGKAMAGYCGLLAQGRFANIEDVLFLHTGGAPTLFTSSLEA